jgi:hypothetical protein
MKKGLFISFVLILIFSLSITDNLIFSGGSKPVAILMSSSGNVKIFTNKGKYVRSGARLTKIYPNQIVSTERGSSCTVLFRDRSTVKLGPESKVLLSKVNFNSKQRKAIGVLKGGVYVSVYKSGGSKSFHAFTPTAVAGVRGTEFSINVADDGSTRCSVAEGTVSFGPEEKQQNLRREQYGELETGKGYQGGRVKRNTQQEDKDWINKRNKEVRRNPSASMSALEKEALQVKNDNTKTYREVRQMRGQKMDKGSASKVAELDYEAVKNSARARAIKESSNNMVRKYGNRRGVRARARRISQYTSAVQRQIQAMDRFISNMAAQVQKLIKQQSDAINDLQKNFMKRGFRK